MSCRVCGCDLMPMWSMKERESGPVADISICSNCFFVIPKYKHPIDPSLPEDVKWPEFTDQSSNWQEHSNALKRMIEGWLGEWINRDALVYEFGSGRGVMAAALLELGYNYSGCEPSDTAWVARQVFPQLEGLVDQQGYESWSPPDSPGTVIAWHVLEHVANPVHCLCAGRNLLKSGGRFIAQVPTLRQEYLYPKHQILFTQAAVEWLVGQVGMELEMCTPGINRGFLAFVARKV